MPHYYISNPNFTISLPLSNFSDPLGHSEPHKGFLVLSALVHLLRGATVYFSAPCG